MAESQTDSEEGEYYVRCPECGHTETDLPTHIAHEKQKDGCPECDDSRGMGVSTMDNL